MAATPVVALLADELVPWRYSRAIREAASRHAFAHNIQPIPHRYLAVYLPLDRIDRYNCTVNAGPLENPAELPMENDPLARKAHADLIIERAAQQLRLLLHEAAAELDPFPPFPGAFFSYGIELEPPGIADAGRGCVVLAPDGELYKLVMEVDFSGEACPPSRVNGYGGGWGGQDGRSRWDGRTRKPPVHWQGGEG